MEPPHGKTFTLLHASGFGSVYRSELLIPLGTHAMRNPTTGALVFDTDGAILLLEDGGGGLHDEAGEDGGEQYHVGGAPPLQNEEEEHHQAFRLISDVVEHDWPSLHSSSRGFAATTSSGFLGGGPSCSRNLDEYESRQLRSGGRVPSTPFSVADQAPPAGSATENGVDGTDGHCWGGGRSPGRCSSFAPRSPATFENKHRAGAASGDLLLEQQNNFAPSSSLGKPDRWTGRGACPRTADKAPMLLQPSGCFSAPKLQEHRAEAPDLLLEEQDDFASSQEGRPRTSCPMLLQGSGCFFALKLQTAKNKSHFDVLVKEVGR